ncbi:MAG: FMN-binding protein [Planctomycetes bacterium]|nr:FMN-binding protein [Planctomycetota bacterium]
MSDALLPVVPEPNPVRLAGTLALAGLLSGLALAFAYDTTLPRIEQNRREALRRAVFEVVPGATAMQKLAWRGGALVVVAEDERVDSAIYAAYGPDGAFLGYAIPAKGAGFQDTIDLIFGFDPRARRIVGMRVLESRETPGLGDKIFKDPKFIENFDALAVEPEVKVVKHGTKHAANEVDGITGATISSKSVVRIISDANAIWLGRLFEPGSEPPLPEGQR